MKFLRGIFYPGILEIGEDPLTDVGRQVFFDATLAPFGGYFLAHGGEHDVLEGGLPSGSVILLAFPDLDHARRWYASDAYQAIKALRTDNSRSHILIVDGVSRDHRATDNVGYSRSAAYG